MTNKILAKKIFALLLGLAGFTMILYYSNWKLCLGILLAMWGNNMEIRYSIISEAKEVLKKLEILLFQNKKIG